MKRKLTTEQRLDAIEASINRIEDMINELAGTKQVAKAPVKKAPVKKTTGSKKTSKKSTSTFDYDLYVATAKRLKVWHKDASCKDGSKGKVFKADRPKVYAAMGI